MRKPIIVEGPDGAGKSTLVRRLAQDLHREAVHTGGPTKTMGAITKRLLEMQSYRPEKVIFDRVTPISHPIYCRAEGRKLIANVKDLHQFLHRFGPVVIYCRLGSAEEMTSLISREKKAHKPKDHLEEIVRKHAKIVELYDETMKLLRDEGLPIVTYNWQKDDYADLLRTLVCVA